MILRPIPGEPGRPPAALRTAPDSRYFSQEIETFYLIALEDEKLVMRQRRLGDATFDPGEVDSFTGGGFNFAFERDRNGLVIGFYLANGRTRDVRFERVR